MPPRVPRNPGPAGDKGREGETEGGDSSIGMKVEVGLRQGYRSRLPTGRTSVGSETQGCPQIVSGPGLVWGSEEQSGA